MCQPGPDGRGPWEAGGDDQISPWTFSTFGQEDFGSYQSTQSEGKNRLKDKTSKSRDHSDHLYNQIVDDLFILFINAVVIIAWRDFYVQKY